MLDMAIFFAIVLSSLKFLAIGGRCGAPEGIASLDTPTA
jgi:hypothetical protein